MKIDWGDNQIALKLSCNPLDQNMAVFSGEVYRLFAIFDKNEMSKKENVEVKLYETMNQKNLTYSLPIDVEKIKEGKNIFSLCARDKIIELKRGQKAGEVCGVSEDLSLKYSVLCDSTAFIGVLKNNGAGSVSGLGESEGVKPLNQPTQTVYQP